MKKGIIIGLVVALLVGGGVAAFFLLQDDAPDPALAGEDAVVVEPEKDPLYRPLSPAFVINFRVRGTIQYLQLGLQVMAYEEEVIEKVETNDPAIRNKLIMLFSGQDYEALATLEGKENLRQEVLLAVNEVLKLDADKGVQDVFFTSFVMQ